ncbi:SPW repeat protein [Telluribacter sp. SYSU D00476]|uniref:SPW repeat protein n=1 Tax=Telluribacter sp. SYSU D00476 TaxID=2811430 RepID=UPI001FF41913|nr:SPW repeat protein [Telluribacter sp. SYSU D00476]
MRFISTKAHGALDYLTGILLIASPWLFGFNLGDEAQWVAIISGAALLLLSVMTDYEMGVMKNIKMSTHLTMDVLMGVFLAASPWLFGFADYVYLPHLIIGIMEIGAGLMTERTPYHSHGMTHSHH